MKAAKLLKMIKESTASVDVKCSQTYKEYFPLIEAHLQSVGDDFDLKGLSSLEEFEDKYSFENFIRSATSDEIKSKFAAILTDAKTCAKLYAKDNSEKLLRAATVQAVYVNWLNQRQHKQHKVIFPLFIVAFVLLAIVVVAFSIMDALNVFAENIAMSKTCTVVSAAAGALDFVAGLSFFIYERHDDKKKREVQEQFEGITNGKIINKGNRVKGNGNNFGIINYSSSEDLNEIVEKKLDDFIAICNVDNVVKGDDNNFGIINKK